MIELELIQKQSSTLRVEHHNLAQRHRTLLDDTLSQSKLIESQKYEIEERERQLQRVRGELDSTKEDLSRSQSIKRKLEERVRINPLSSSMIQGASLTTSMLQAKPSSLSSSLRY